MAEQLYVVVVGCGRLGSHLANRLSREGHSVVAIDVDEGALAGLSQEYGGFRILGDATEVAVLRQAKADKADVIIAATGVDNVNLMVAQVAKRALGVPRVVARVEDPRREGAYRAMGIETVCPTAVAADLFLKWFARGAGEGAR
jgi:trk system potassium uptake protein TrkA